MKSSKTGVYDEIGSLLLFRKESQETIDILFKILPKEKYSYLYILSELINDPEYFIRLLDVMSGIRVTFPDKRKVYKTLEKIVMYRYIKDHDFSEDSYMIMAKQYNKRVSQVKAIVNTMTKNLNNNSNEDKVKSQQLSLYDIFKSQEITGKR